MSYNACLSFWWILIYFYSKITISSTESIVCKLPCYAGGHRFLVWSNLPEKYEQQSDLVFLLPVLFFLEWKLHKTRKGARLLCNFSSFVTGRMRPWEGSQSTKQLRLGFSTIFHHISAEKISLFIFLYHFRELVLLIFCHKWRKTAFFRVRERHFALIRQDWAGTSEPVCAMKASMIVWCRPYFAFSKPKSCCRHLFSWRCDSNSTGIYFDKFFLCLNVCFVESGRFLEEKAKAKTERRDNLPNFWIFCCLGFLNGTDFSWMSQEACKCTPASYGMPLVVFCGISVFVWVDLLFFWRYFEHFLVGMCSYE